jgi:hypothetical protein
LKDPGRIALWKAWEASCPRSALCITRKSSKVCGTRSCDNSILKFTNDTTPWVIRTGEYPTTHVLEMLVMHSARRGHAGPDALRRGPEPRRDAERPHRRAHASVGTRSSTDVGPGGCCAAPAAGALPWSYNWNGARRGGTVPDSLTSQRCAAFLDLLFPLTARGLPGSRGRLGLCYAPGARAKTGKSRDKHKKANPRNIPKVWAFSYLGDAPCRFIK